MSVYHLVIPKPSLSVWAPKVSVPFFLSLNSTQKGRSGLENRSDIKKNCEDLALRKLKLGEGCILKQRGPLSCRNNDSKVGQVADLFLELG